MRHRITHRAERDLKDIYRHTFENFGHTQAEKYLRELDAVFELLGDYPNMGRFYEEQDPSVRPWQAHHPLSYGFGGGSLSAASSTAPSGDLHHNDIDTRRPA